MYPDGGAGRAPLGPWGYSIAGITINQVSQRLTIQPSSQVLGAEVAVHPGQTAARLVQPVLDAAGPEMDRRRECTPEVVDALAQQDLLRMLLPALLMGPLVLTALSGLIASLEARADKRELMRKKKLLENEAELEKKKKDQEESN